MTSVVVPITSAVKSAESISADFRARVAEGFNRLFKETQVPHPDSPGGALPAVGPWNLPIDYDDQGRPVHEAAGWIVGHRPLRPFTTNAVELRCDCLGLVVYVSGVVQLTGTGGAGTRHARVVSYLKDSTRPFRHEALSGWEPMINELHQVLMSTYNELAAAHNIAGFPGAWLTLRSSAPAVIPDIPITLSALAKSEPKR